MGKANLKVQFTDFWPGFNPLNNSFYFLLKNYFDVEISDTPDVLFFSCFNTNFLKFRCPRIFYTGENIRPDFRFCDFAITFDYLELKRHFRLPLYRRWFSESDLTKDRGVHSIMGQERGFCSFVVSNARESEERIRFFHALSEAKQVASGGKYANNIGGPVPDKRAFIRNYKFNIAFENSSYPGYTTEKIAEAWVEGCIPIYWGNPRIEEEINPDCFINVGKFSSHHEAIEYILEVDTSEELYIKYLEAPFFRNNVIPDELRDETISLKLKTFIEEALNLDRIAAQWWHKPYFYARKIKGFNRLAKIDLR